MGLTFDELPHWEFSVTEVSAGAYRVRAVRNGGITGEGTGSDPDGLIDDYRQWARQVDADLVERESDGRRGQDA